MNALFAQGAIKIMPVGNSITAGEHYGVPPVPERTGYRKDLYEMLIDAGYNVDFVGSQKHGERTETDTNWYDWNSESYPGWRIGGIAGKIKVGLGIYKPDILLVHVGTNGQDWDKKPGQVMDMLDSINKYSVDNDHPMTVFLCKIIKRFIDSDFGHTSQFNIDIADSVAVRAGDKIKIIMVDMENGAGLDYTDRLPDPTAIPPNEGGDMWGRRYPGVPYDHCHPNDKGNTKMAAKFYEELVKELDPPETMENNMVDGIELSATADSTIKITWAANFLDEDGYHIERAETEGEFSIVGTADANTRYFIDSSADAEKEYKYRIKAFNNAGGESLYSSEVTYTPTYFSLTTSVIGEGTVSPSPSPSNGLYLMVGSGTAVNLTATPAQGWKFKKWSGDITFYTYSNPIEVCMNSDFSAIANFVQISDVVAADPIADYSFDVDASDATGNFNGTLEGDAAIIDDADRGRVLSLTETGYVSIPPTIAATMENWSFTAWVYFAGTNPWAGIIGMGMIAPKVAPYCDFHIRSSGTLSFYISEVDVWPGDGSAQVCDLNLFDLDPGWIHVALTFELGSLPVFYINGEEQTSTDWNSSNDHDVSPKLINPEVAMIGKDAFNQTTLTHTRIDEVKFFDTALAWDEIVAIYNGATSVEEKVGLISSYQLTQNYPNPFNPETTIKFDIPESSKVKLSIFNIIGQEVAVLVDDFRHAGTYSASFNRSNLTSGVYFYRLEANGHNTTKRMLLMK